MMTTDTIANLRKEIDPNEVLIRSLSSDVVKKGRPHWRVFRPPVGEPMTSVMRALMGGDFCKNKSKEIARDRYIGMAAITVSQVLDTDAKVHDAQNEYPGHAHIDHIDPPVLANDPSEPDQNIKLNNRCKTLAGLARVYLDPAPEVAGWQGPELI